MEARNRSLNNWFVRIRSRQIVLPRFQRFEAWTHSTVAGLLDTVLTRIFNLMFDIPTFQRP